MAAADSLAVNTFLTTLILPLYQLHENSYKRYNKFKDTVEKYGLLVTLLLYFVFTDARFVMARVRVNLVHARDDQVVAFMESYTSGFNMIGVAGAIVAQIAISALSAIGLADSHWTAEAFFIASLVTGCLSVFFSCTISPAFHGLHTAENIKDFFFKPISSPNTQMFNAGILNAIKQGHWLGSIKTEEIDQLSTIAGLRRWEIPSAYAAIMLVVPMTLLKIALTMFLIGLGIYLGKVHTAGLIKTFGDGSIGILVFYLVSVLLGISMYYAAQTMKYFEGTPVTRWHHILDMLKERRARNENTAEERPEEDSPPPNHHFQQSRHVREGSRVYFTTDGNIEVSNSTSVHTPPSERPETFTRDEILPRIEKNASSGITEEFVSPGRTEKQAPSITADKTTPKAPHTTAKEIHPEETVTPPVIDPRNIQNILKELIRAQEESLRINQRLLEALTQK